MLVASSCPDVAGTLAALQGQPSLQFLYLKGALHAAADGGTPRAVPPEVRGLRVPDLGCAQSTHRSHAQIPSAEGAPLARAGLCYVTVVTLGCQSGAGTLAGAWQRPHFTSFAAPLPWMSELCQAASCWPSWH